MADNNLFPGLIVFIVTVIVVVAVAAIGPFLAPAGGSIESGQNLSITEYEEATVPEQIESGGTIRPEVPGPDQSGMVLIDDNHQNGFNRDHVAPLARALTESGNNVQFHALGDDLASQLNKAKAFVVMTPATGFSEQEVKLIDEFTDRGGRLLLVAEPDQVEIRGGILAAQLVKTSDATTSLASAHGVSFDTRYLYNLQTNDGNYKHVIAEPAGGTLDGVDRATVYTATTVSARGGTPLLTTTEDTRLSGSDAAGEYPVAVRAGNTIALGDRTMLRSDRYTVADNEAVVARIVEFLAAGQNVTGLEGVGAGAGTGGRTTAGASGP